MRELPISFSTPMVQATLENRKTMTRRTNGIRLVNDCPDEWVYDQEIKPKFSFKHKQHGFITTSNPRYQVGDKLWVRETFFNATKYKSAPLFANGSDYIYRADSDAFIGEHKWKSPRFMPKIAARIWLEVTGVRCERLQSISHEDCIAEGILELAMSAAQQAEQGRKFFDYSKPKQFFTEGLDPFWSFNSLWCSINGGDSWDLNPWVFIYEFKRIEKDQFIWIMPKENEQVEFVEDGKTE